MLNNHYAINAIKERISKLDEEKDALEDFIRQFNLNFGMRKPEAIQFKKPVVLKEDANTGTFQEWLHLHNIRMKKGDKNDKAILLPIHIQKELGLWHGN